MSAVPPARTRAPLAVVRQWYATGDASLLAEDVVWRVLPAWPAGGEYRGRRAVVERFFPALLAPFAEYGAEPTELLEVAAGRDASGDAERTIVALGEYRGRAASGLGATFASAFAHVLRVREGRVARFDQVADTAAVRDALAGG